MEEDDDCSIRLNLTMKQPNQGELSDSCGEPVVGMMFETMEETRQYYVEYGKRLGFGIRTRSTSKTKSRSNEVTGATFVCVRERELQRKAPKERLTTENEKGKIAMKKRSTSTVKTGCLAYMRVFHDVCTMKWKGSQFEKEHNHNFVFPSKRSKMRPLKEMPTAARDLAETFGRERLPVGKVPSIFGGDNATFGSRDYWNHMTKIRQSSNEVEDVVATLNYFRMKLTENPRFYYAAQYDEEGRVANLFWVDARSRDAYRHFGDVVTFDTTYRTNKYNMPFAPFTGVNHHNQSILFG